MPTPPCLLFVGLLAETNVYSLSRGSGNSTEFGEFGDGYCLENCKAIDLKTNSVYTGKVAMGIILYPLNRY